MNRYDKHHIASSAPAPSRSLQRLIAVAVIGTGLCISGPLLAEEPTPAEVFPVSGDYLEPVTDANGSGLSSLAQFSRKLTRSLADSNLRADADNSGLETNWFNIRPERNQADASVTPITDDGDFGGLMVNIELMY
jgi:hypothetical protein